MLEKPARCQSVGLPCAGGGIVIGQNDLAVQRKRRIAGMFFGVWVSIDPLRLLCRLAVRSREACARAARPVMRGHPECDSLKEAAMDDGLLVGVDSDGNIQCS
jgi:hypothetical protein